MPCRCGRDGSVPRFSGTGPGSAAACSSAATGNCDGSGTNIPSASSSRRKSVAAQAGWSPSAASGSVLECWSVGWSLRSLPPVDLPGRADVRFHCLLGPTAFISVPRQHDTRREHGSPACLVLLQTAPAGPIATNPARHSAAFAPLSPHDWATLRQLVDRHENSGAGLDHKSRPATSLGASCQASPAATMHVTPVVAVESSVQLPCSET